MRSFVSFVVLVVALAIDHLPLASAVPITINPAECVKDFGLYNWSVKRFGPYIICRDGTVTFQWRGMHGLFQIPTIACPSNFTSQEAETYKFLAPASNGGGFEWKIPNKTGHYWVTSQWQNDCRNGMIGEFYVVDPASAPFKAGARRSGMHWSIPLAFTTALFAMATLWL